MRFTQFFLLAPALLALAQQDSSTTTNSDSSTSNTSVQSSNTNNSNGGSSQTSSSSSSSSSGDSSSSSASASQSSSNDDDSDSNIVTRTWNGGRATLVTNAGGNIVGTVFGPKELASTLNDNDNLGTIVSNLPPTVYTTTGEPQQTGSSSDNGMITRTVGGGPVTLILSNDNIVGTVYGPKELASTINDNDGLKTRVSSVPLTTFTTSEGIAQQTQGGSDNAAPAASAAPMLAGGLIGAGMVVVGLL